MSDFIQLLVAGSQAARNRRAHREPESTVDATHSNRRVKRRLP
jgi:hypothetical protein